MLLMHAWTIFQQIKWIIGLKWEKKYQNKIQETENNKTKFHKIKRGWGYEEGSWV